MIMENNVIAIFFLPLIREFDMRLFLSLFLCIFHAVKQKMICLMINNIKLVIREMLFFIGSANVKIKANEK